MNSGPAMMPQASRVRFMIKTFPADALLASLTGDVVTGGGIGHDQEALVSLSMAARRLR
jgi:hypothetical protein